MGKQDREEGKEPMKQLLDNPGNSDIEKQIYMSSYQRG
jgi:hypothetical protein